MLPKLERRLRLAKQLLRLFSALPLFLCAASLAELGLGVPVLRNALEHPFEFPDGRPEAALPHGAESPLESRLHGVSLPGPLQQLFELLVGSCEDRPQGTQSRWLLQP